MLCAGVGARQRIPTPAPSSVRPERLWDGPTRRHVTQMAAPHAVTPGRGAGWRDTRRAPRDRPTLGGMRDFQTMSEIIDALEELTGTPETVHEKADEILLAAMPEPVRDAYLRAVRP